jgi:hypothetical protein
MSLAPAERRILTEIGESLGRSDPGLARMLTRFRLPISRGGWEVLIRRLPRLKPLLPAAVTVIMVVMLILVIAFSSHASPQCAVHSGLRSATTTQLSGCPPASGRTGTTGNGQ